MEDLGPAFDVRANGRRCLKAAGLSFGCMLAIWLLSLAAADSGFDWKGRISAGCGIMIFAVFGWVCSMAAWVRWLDWTRGRAQAMKGKGMV